MSNVTVIVEAEPGDAWMALGEHIARRAFGILAIVTVWGEADLDSARRYALTSAQARWALVVDPPDPSAPTPALMDAVGVAVHDFAPARVLGPVGIGSARREALRAAVDGLFGSDADLYLDLPAAADPAHQRDLIAAIDELEPTVLSARARSIQARTAAHLFPDSRRPTEWRYAVDHGVEMVLGDPMP